MLTPKLLSGWGCTGSAMSFGQTPAQLQLYQPCQRGHSLSLLLIQPWGCPSMWGGVWHSHSTLPFMRYAVAPWPSEACALLAECRTAAFWQHQHWRPWAYAAQDSLRKQPMFVDTSLRLLDRLLQPMSHNHASRGKCNLIGTVDHQTGGSSVAHMSW